MFILSDFETLSTFSLLIQTTMNYTEESFFEQDYFQPQEDIFSMFLNNKNNENKETEFVCINNENVESVSKSDNINIFANFYENIFNKGNEQCEPKKEQKILNRKRSSIHQNRKNAQAESFDHRKHLFKTFKNDEKNDLKKKQRMMKNRISAKKCRQKKKVYIKELEKEVNELKSEIKQIRAFQIKTLQLEIIVTKLQTKEKRTLNIKFEFKFNKEKIRNNKNRLHKLPASSFE